jgi:hypothetical protein
MSIDLQQVLNSPSAVRFLAGLARGFHHVLAIRCVTGLEIGLPHREAKLTGAVRLNQWMARGANLREAALDEAVRETLRNNARNIHSLYHYLGHPMAMQQMLCSYSISSSTRLLVERATGIGRIIER